MFHLNFIAGQKLFEWNICSFFFFIKFYEKKIIRTPRASSRCFKSPAAKLDKWKFSDILIFDSRGFSLLSTLSNSNSQIAGTTLLRYKNTDGQNLWKYSKK